ncbi:hypothetical protein ACFQT0_21490 [Hymenobacter humi]|uniref:Uncharacterized protein n=1 Tax=Hymenobacter humi TaxID=1411620 RepID=A0ABW2UB71_9BACT
MKGHAELVDPKLGVAKHLYRFVVILSSAKDLLTFARIIQP